MNYKNIILLSMCLGLISCDNDSSSSSDVTNTDTTGGTTAIDGLLSSSSFPDIVDGLYTGSYITVNGWQFAPSAFSSDGILSGTQASNEKLTLTLAEDGSTIVAENNRIFVRDVDHGSFTKDDLLLVGFDGAIAINGVLRQP